MKSKLPLICTVHLLYYQLLKMVPKRVILYLQESDFPDISYNNLTQSVETYLTFSGCSAEELAQERYFFHFQPPNLHILQKNLQFHIITNIEKMEHLGPL